MQCSRGLHATLVLGVILAATSPARAQDEEAAPPAPVLPHVKLEGNAPPAVALKDAIGTALARNPTAAVAYAEIQRARAIVEEVRSGALPTLYGNLTYTQLDSARAYLGVVQVPASGFQANALLTVPLIVPKPWAQWSQAKDRVDVASRSAEDTRRLVAVSVARAYLTIVAQKRVIDAAARARDTDRAHYEYSHLRYAGGVGNRIDEVRAQQQLASDEANVQQQYSNLARDREALGVLVGVGGPLDAEEPVLRAPNDEKQAMTEAEHRTDVRTAEAQLHATRHAVHDDWTDYSPYLTGTFLPFYQDPPLVTYPTTGWQAELILTVPLFDGGLRYGQQKERGVARDEAKLQ
ncbi:MAG TPA: TolC family protein, partial [Polyangiaceae bacterium]|nr:TolC family protein [Polyangiaceae bacterium]